MILFFLIYAVIKHTLDSWYETTENNILRTSLDCVCRSLNK
jgi:hypothetical protein